MISYEKFIKKFANTVRNRKILDLGCGNGNYTVIFSKNNNRVIGADVNDFRHKKYSKKFDFVKYDGERLPFKYDSFDLVVSFDVIEHVEDDVNYLKEIKRVLKKNGMVFLATPNRNRLSNCLLKLVGREVKYPLVLSEDGRLGAVIHIREYTKKELKKLLQSVGFGQIRVQSFWFGLRGRVNIGVERPLIKGASQYLFATAKK